MKTNVTELDDSRVRVEVDVDPADVEGRIQRTAQGLGRELRIPGFRKGKVPPAMVIQRVGREAVLEQALQDALGEWYERAMLTSGVRPIGDPKLDLGDLPAMGEPLSFSIEVAVRPRAKLGEYKGLEVGRREPDVPDEAVDAEIERLREGFASLETVEREAKEGDFVLVDFVGMIDGEPFEGGEARDYLLELGSGRTIEGFEEQLAGAAAGEERELKVSFPDDYEPEHLAGKDAVFAATVKEVKEKKLPPLDDDFASDASEFDTLAELRSDIGDKLGHAIEHRIEDEFREAVVDAAVDKATVEVPEEVIQARAEETWDRVVHSLSHQGVDAATYLEQTGRTREQVVEDARPEAEKALKREAVLDAVAEAEAIEISDEELLEAIGPAAERDKVKPEKMLKRLKSSGRDALLRDDLRARKAVDVMAKSAIPIPLEQAEAREKIWTPEKEEAEKEKPELWTPGSEKES